MRDLLAGPVARHRVDASAQYGSLGDAGNGVFVVKSPIDGVEMLAIASDGAEWDHVSVSRAKRCPNWPEMDHVRRLFFEDVETVMQLHVPPSENVDNAATCLHLWRPQSTEIPRPPGELVGVLASKVAQ